MSAVVFDRISSSPPNSFDTPPSRCNSQRRCSSLLLLCIVSPLATWVNTALTITTGLAAFAQSNSGSITIPGIPEPSEVSFSVLGTGTDGETTYLASPLVTTIPGGIAGPGMSQCASAYRCLTY